MLITRPRISLGAMSCTSDVVIEKVETSSAPPTKSSSSLSHNWRENANAIITQPNAKTPPSSARPIARDLPSHATVMAPSTAPEPEKAIIWV